MDIKIAIGRGVEGSNAIRVPTTFEKVSRHHATLHWCNGNATIEDNRSANGTFVNGSRVTIAQLQEDDIIWLGGFGPGCYRLDLEQILASCREKEEFQYNNSSQQVFVANRDPVETYVSDCEKQQQTQQSIDDKPANYLGLAIVTALFNLLFGIAAIIYAVRVNKLWEKGDTAGAEKASKNVRVCSITGLILGVVGIIRIILSMS